MARKPRDYDAELQALMDKAKKVRTQKTTQLGELVQIVGADAFAHGGPGRGTSRRRQAEQGSARRHGEVDRGGQVSLSARRQAREGKSSRRRCSRNFRRQRLSSSA